MALNDPVAAYNAADNIEAQLVCSMLQAAGVEAFAVEDVSRVGTWMGGLLPQVHKPQVWIDCADIERARPILEDYVRRAEERRSVDNAGPPVDVVCEECGRGSVFPANQKGTVQNCPHCQAFVDVGDEIPFDDWEETLDESEDRGDG